MSHPSENNTNTLLEEFQIFLNKDQKKSLTISTIRCIEQMFDFTYIFINTTFRKAILSNPKGYVPFNLIFQQQKFSKHLIIGGLPPIKKSEYQQLGIYLYCQILKYSKKLWANPGSVRKIKNYQDKQVKAVYVQNFPIQNKCEQFQTLIASKCSYTKIDYDKQLTCAIVYTDNPQALINLNGYRWNGREESYSDSFRVYSCEEFERLESYLNKRPCLKIQNLYLQKSQLQYPCFQEFKLTRKIDKKQHEQDEYELQEQFQTQLNEFKQYLR